MADSETRKTTFAPGIVLPTGETYTPTGDEWLLFFAINGCRWAIDAIEEKRRAAITAGYESAVDYPTDRGMPT